MEITNNVMSHEVPRSVSNVIDEPVRLLSENNSEICGKQSDIGLTRIGIGRMASVLGFLTFVGLSIWLVEEPSKPSGDPSVRPMG